MDEAPQRRIRLLPAVIAGAYSWALTVVPPAVLAGPTSLAMVFAAFALLSLVAALFLPPGRLALIAALDVFLGACIVSWWGSAGADSSLSFGLFGSFGWIAYTLALGALSTPASDQELQEPGPPLNPRTPPSKLAAVVLLGVALSALVLLGTAWKVERPAIAVLAHVLAVGVALITVRAGARLAVYFQVHNTRLGAELSLKRSVWPLLALAGLVLAGLYWALAAPAAG